MAEARTKIILEAVDQTRAAFDSAKSGLQRVSTAANTASKILASLGVGLSVGGLAAFIKKSIDAADSLGELAQKTGSTVEQLVGFRLAAEQSGTDLNSIALGARNLAKELTDTPEKFRKIGITTQDTTEAMIQLADLFADLPDGAQKSALAMQLFGKQGTDLIPLLNEGSAGLRKMIDEGKRFGPITSEMARQADAFKDSLAILKLSASDLGVSMANDILPELNNITAAMIQARKEGENLGVVLGVGFGGFLTEMFSTPDKVKELQGAKRELNELIIQQDTLLLRLERLQKTGKDTSSVLSDLAEVTKKVGAASANVDKLISPQSSSGSPEKNNPHEGFLKQVCEIGGGTWKNGKCERGGGASGELKRMLEQDAKAFNDLAATLNAGSIANKTFADNFNLLNRALAGGLPGVKLARDEYDALVLKMVDGTEDVRDAQEALARSAEKAQAITNSLKDQSRGIAEQLNPQQAFNDTLKLYKEQLEGNKISQEEYNLLFDDSISKMIEKTKAGTAEMSEFAKQGARNMQSHLADFLFDPFDDGLKGMLKGFADTLRRMTAEAAAAKIFEAIGFGNGNKGGSGKDGFVADKDNGVLTSIFKIGANIFGSGGGFPSFDVGTPFVPRDMLAMVHKGEAVIPAKYNKPGGGGDTNNVSITLNVQAGVSQTVRAEMMALLPLIKQEAIAGVIEAKRRGGRTGSGLD